MIEGRQADGTEIPDCRKATIRGDGPGHGAGYLAGGWGSASLRLEGPARILSVPWSPGAAAFRCVPHNDV
jgi:hypothetical protein